MIKAVHKAWRACFDVKQLQMSHKCVGRQGWILSYSHIDVCIRLYSIQYTSRKKKNETRYNSENPIFSNINLIFKNIY